MGAIFKKVKKLLNLLNSLQLTFILLWLIINNKRYDYFKVNDVKSSNNDNLVSFTIKKLNFRLTIYIGYKSIIYMKIYWCNLLNTVCWFFFQFINRNKVRQLLFCYGKKVWSYIIIYGGPGWSCLTIFISVTFFHRK